MNENNNGKEILLKSMANRYKYYNANSFGFHNFGLEESLFENYFIFCETFNSLKENNRFDDLDEAYNTFVEKNEDEEENDKIAEEIDDIVKKYNTIAKEVDENFNFYYKFLYKLSIKYRNNWWKKEIGKICYNITIGINELLVNKYIDYENKLFLIVDKINNLNLKLTIK